MDPRPKLPPPKIIAHRGSSAHAPENTLAAFELAVAGGAEGIEFDVRLTRDGEAVVIHDADLKRTGLRKGIVSGMTAAELAEVDVGTWFNRKHPAKNDPVFAKERVAALAAALERLKDFPGLIYIELKCEPAGARELCEAVCRVIRDSPRLSQMIVKSFELGAIPIIRELCPGIQTAALFGARLMNALRKETRIIRAAKAVGAHQISVHYSLATRRLVSRASEARLPVTIWTADSPRWVERGAKLGLKAIITNDPARLLARKREIEKVAQKN
jgi:glycerophosphoryl diester phosphodiesterase